MQGSDTLTWLKGRHTFKAGVDIQYVEYRDQISFFDGEELGRYVFDGSFTGQAFADFLLGLPRFTGYILPAPDVNPFATYYAGFVQDAWRPVGNLTIDVGLRYDLRPPMKDRSNQLGNFDTTVPGGRVIVSDEAGPGAGAGFRPPVGAEHAVRDRGRGRAAQDAAPNRQEQLQPAPRRRVAPGRLGPTVLRGGVGLYTVPLLGSVNYSMVATVTAAAVGFANNLREPVRVPEHLVGGIGRGPVPPGTLDFRRANQIDMRDPRTTQWSLTLERDLGCEHRRARQLHRLDRRTI